MVVTMKKPNLQILVTSIGLGLFVWLLDAAMDYFLLSGGIATESLVREFTRHELYHGIAILLCFTGAGIICSRLTTRQKRIEDALRVNDQILQSAQRIAHVGSWHFDIKNNHLTWSDEVYRIFGKKPQEFGATYEAFMESVHPDDRELVDSTYQHSIKHKAPYNIIHRIIRPNGEIRIVHEKSEDIQDEAGNTIHSFGMVHDITELKAADEEKEKLISRLQKALSEVKTLRGIIPICSFCKKIRDDKGYWDRVDIYLMHHTEADFSHCICPECMKKNYPEIKGGDDDKIKPIVTAE
jgi:PAS domain S-box-containing protein